MAIAERVKDWWPTTDRELEAKEELYPRAKSRAITDATRRAYYQFAPGLPVPPLVEEEDLEAYIAASAVLRLIPLARDYYKEGMLSRSASLDHGGGSGSESLYNKLDALTTLEDRLQEEISLLTPIVTGLFQDEEPSTTFLADVPTVRRQRSLLIDPITMAKER